MILIKEFLRALLVAFMAVALFIGYLEFTDFRSLVTNANKNAEIGAQISGKWTEKEKETIARNIPIIIQKMSELVERQNRPIDFNKLLETLIKKIDLNRVFGPSGNGPSYNEYMREHDH